MKASDVTELYTTLGEMGVTIWLDGGWGVDALLGEQTRPHSDLDIVIQKQDVATLNALLTARGYRDVPRDDTSPHNYVLGDDETRLIDVHVVELDAAGNGIFGPVENGVMYPAAALSGRGAIGGTGVRCISPEWVVRFHSGYSLRESDYHDVLAVCRKFGIEAPEEYQEQREDELRGVAGHESGGDVSRVRQFGSVKDSLTIADDFDAPLDDFAEYR